ncbi:hypothetical protein PV04_06041 [Phialophora macrospora]|uniref:Uncharacterized protein n=1 Tax=Phialophora macrospora TaxID=1851006 RepID=A0A0D2CND0_9EURO|nr:hypothetical protein PV04_06041 [Phialophora macrospora]
MAFPLPPPRRSTTISTRTERTFTRPLGLLRRRTELDASPVTQDRPLQAYYFPVYRLPWDRLRNYLETIFPDLKGTFVHKIAKDHYVFKSYRPLKQDEEMEILKLRDGEARDPKRTEDSPEPPSRSGRQG